MGSPMPDVYCISSKNQVAILLHLFFVHGAAPAGMEIFIHEDYKYSEYDMYSIESTSTRVCSSAIVLQSGQGCGVLTLKQRSQFLR